MAPYRALGSMFLVFFSDKLYFIIIFKKLLSAVIIFYINFIKKKHNFLAGNMTAVRVDPEEVLRRENYIREYQRPKNLRDPFTWKYPYRAAGLAVLLTAGSAHLHNLWMRKPWHYGEIIIFV